MIIIFRLRRDLLIDQYLLFLHLEIFTSNESFLRLFYGVHYVCQNKMMFFFFRDPHLTPSWFKSRVTAIPTWMLSKALA